MKKDKACWRWGVPVALGKVIIEDGFWQRPIANNRLISLPYQYERLEASGVLANFRRVLGEMDGPYAGPFWMDSDAYKWLEASAYTLATHGDRSLKQKAEKIIALIAAVQEPNGYLNTYFQYVEPDKKFTNLGIGHELYCAGHLLQAATAMYRAIGHEKFLQVARRLADHLASVFSADRLRGVPGHQEIELALIDLYRETGEDRYLRLAEFFIWERGNPDSRLRWELAHLPEIGGRLGKPGQLNPVFFGTYENYDGRYAQDHLPLSEQREAVGHAVRAMYYYCGITDLYLETGDERLFTPLMDLWENVVFKKMYITGGIGSSHEIEGFGGDYDLPNETAYAETCAAVGMVMWNHRLLQTTGESRYADVLERVLYNGFLSGVSLDGRRYFYVNPLASNGTHHRQGWFEVACCPPNMARLFASLGNYIYSLCPDGLAVHLYIQSKVEVDLPGGGHVLLHQKTAYPWDGRVELQIQSGQPADFTLYLRIPGWCRQLELTVNGEAAAGKRKKGYVLLKRRWSPGDRVVLHLVMPVEKVKAHPKVQQNTGRIALQRGPLVYCLEQTDHQVPVEEIIVPEECLLTARYDPEMLEGAVVIEGRGWCRDGFTPFKAIPYYLWDNREPGAMAVWLRTEKGGGKQRN